MSLVLFARCLLHALKHEKPKIIQDSKIRIRHQDEFKPTFVLFFSIKNNEG